jgi:hypothetical protein
MGSRKSEEQAAAAEWGELPLLCAKAAPLPRA